MAINKSLYDEVKVNGVWRSQSKDGKKAYIGGKWVPIFYKWDGSGEFTINPKHPRTKNPYK